MWSLNKYLIVGVVAVVVIPSSWLIRSVDAQSNVTVSEKCNADFLMLATNTELDNASGSYKCAFTGEKCTADYQGKQDEYVKICRKLGGVPYEVDITSDCVGPTNVKTSVAFDNDAYCMGTNCTTAEVSELARLSIINIWSLSNQTCTATASNPMISTAAKATSAAAGPHGLSLSNMGWVTWIGSSTATLLATIAFIVV